MPLIHSLGTRVHVDLGEGIDAEEFAAAWSRCLRSRQRDIDDRRWQSETTDTPTITDLGSMTQLT